MVKTLPPNTVAALQNALTKGLIKRDFIWFRGRNRETGELETVGIGALAMASIVPVIRPDNGNVVDREYQAIKGAFTIPPIPASLKLEERRIRLQFSRLSPEIINAVRVYNVKGEPVEIHRGFFDPDTMNLIDPCHCRFDGFVRSVRIKRPKVGNDGAVMMEIVDHSASLKTNPVKVSKAFFLDRDGDRGGDWVDSDPDIVWGQKEKIREKKKQPRVKLWR